MDAGNDLIPVEIFGISIPNMYILLLILVIIVFWTFGTRELPLILTGKYWYRKYAGNFAKPQDGERRSRQEEASAKNASAGRSRREREQEQSRRNGQSDNDEPHDTDGFESREASFRRHMEESRYKNALSLFDLRAPYSLEELVSRRKFLLMRAHPDQGGSTGLTVAVNEAFEVLKQRLVQK